MNDKQDVLKRARAEFEHWEQLLARLSESQIVAKELAGGWSIKDVIAHLKAWQELSMMRLEAGQYGKEPVRPNWPEHLDLVTESNVDETNAWIYATHHDLPWSSVFSVWRYGYLRFLALGEAIPENMLLKKKRYDWIEGYSLADSLINSAEHHREHREILLEWLADNEKGS
jgi:hypothetical protein